MATTKPAAATPGVFELDDAHTAAYEASAPRGKAATPSPYLDAVREAIKSGTAKGVAVVGKDADEQEKHSRKIYNDLKKAANQLSNELDGAVVKIETRMRLNHPKLPPFVGFSAKIEKVAPAETKTGE